MAPQTKSAQATHSCRRRSLLKGVIFAPSGADESPFVEVQLDSAERQDRRERVVMRKGETGCPHNIKTNNKVRVEFNKFGRPKALTVIDDENSSFWKHREELFGEINRFKADKGRNFVIVVADDPRDPQRPSERFQGYFTECRGAWLYSATRPRCSLSSLQISPP